jgi:hypothetical protein
VKYDCQLPSARGLSFSHGVSPAGTSRRKKEKNDEQDENRIGPDVENHNAENDHQTAKFILRARSQRMCAYE